MGRFLFFGVLVVLLSGCGFRPLYEAGGSTDLLTARLASVDVGPVPDRLGQVLTNQLVDRMKVSGENAYRLDVTLDQSTRGFGVRPDASVAQEELTLIANVSLVDNQSGETVVVDRLRARGSYDVVLSDFANVQQREDAARRLVLDLAERIERRLVLYFSEQS